MYAASDNRVWSQLDCTTYRDLFIHLGYLYKLVCVYIWDICVGWKLIITCKKLELKICFSKFGTLFDTIGHFLKLEFTIQIETGYILVYFLIMTNIVLVQASLLEISSTSAAQDHLNRFVRVSVPQGLKNGFN